MVVLALEMSGADTKVGLELGGKVFERRHEPGAHRQHRAPIPAISSLLEEHAVTLDQIDMVAFAAGPGHFSGLRVACATAQAICQTKGCLIRPVNTMLALAHETSRDKVVVALPAYRDHYFVAIYSSVEGMISAEIEAAVYPAGQLPALGDTGWTTVGKGFDCGDERPAKHYAKFVRGHCSKDYPSTKAIIEVAKTHFPKNARLDPLRITPIYARPKVAETVEEREMHRGKSNGRG